MSRPYEGQIKSGSLSIALSRRIDGADGEFAGIVAAEIALEDIYGLFQNLSIGPNGSIALFHDHGTLMIRLPYERNEIGLDLGQTPTFQQFRQKGSGTFAGISVIDEVSRLHSYNRIYDLPLILTVSLSADDILAPWWRRAPILLLVAGILCGAVFRLMFMFRRELERRRRAEHELEQLSRLDALTGLANRRAFDKALAREWRQAIRSRSWLSLLFIDVDHFKSYNDRYGHAKGDGVLRAIADATASTVRRPHDLAARYGGEELTVVLPETALSEASAVADAIRRAVTSLRIEREGSIFGVATVSIGVASAQPSQVSDAASLLREADMALYDAKAAGRNRVSLSSPDMAGLLGRDQVLANSPLPT